MNSHYKLRCLGDGSLLEDTWYTNTNSGVFGHLLSNPNYAGDALLRTEYEKPLHIDHSIKNIFKYSWLPVKDTFDCTTGPIAFKSTEMAKHLGLSNLYFTFSGYAPRLGAYNRSGTFKEFEAAGVLGRHGLDNKATIVLASAGNTARGFIEVGSQLDIPIIIVIPESVSDAVWTVHDKIGDNISLYTSTGDYADAIHIANEIASFDGYVAEGGVKNVGRRDGMGAGILAAVEYMQRIPDHYFQAVGSASGALSAWEAAIRYNSFGKMAGAQQPVLHVSQNRPFTPIIDSWQAGASSWQALDIEKSYEQIAEINAKVLSNRKPPYSIKGGIVDAMTASNGKGYRVSNEEAKVAQALFFEKEQLLLGKASSVTFASLLQAVKQDPVSPDDYILMHITGGGEDLIQNDFTVQRAIPKATISAQASRDDIWRTISH